MKRGDRVQSRTNALAPFSQGLVCNATKVCQKIKFAGPGEACGSVNGDFVACRASGHCKVAAGQMMGTCLAAADDGAACDPVNGPTCKAVAVCAGGVCTLDDGLSCK